MALRSWSLFWGLLGGVLRHYRRGKRFPLGLSLKAIVGGFCWFRCRLVGLVGWGAVGGLAV
jgi:hypothetical protein